MPRVDYVRSAEDGKLVKIAVVTDEDRVVYTVSATLYARLGGFSRGEEISEDVLRQIQSEHEYRSAKKKALNILAYADNNERTLAMKLMRGGTRRECAKDVAREMVSLGYINEEEQLDRLVAIDANSKLFGEGRIIRHLASRGYSTSDIRRAIERLVSDGEIDFRKNAKRLLEKYSFRICDTEEKRKILYRYGYKVSLASD